ncbi:hypothetical protein AGOR_G00248140 [Albula goreensis]|uniref:Uncharacterized protein n=1 Tax=Albula goreensis TaxID=1534307 RepID=A0A8T3CEB2_9TELE|nr:hypothetical protein AGOR_G00248140 [Albula goreensis]
MIQAAVLKKKNGTPGPAHPRVQHLTALHHFCAAAFPFYNTRWRQRVGSVSSPEVTAAEMWHQKDTSAVCAVGLQVSGGR